MWKSIRPSIRESSSQNHSLIHRKRCYSTRVDMKSPFPGLPKIVSTPIDFSKQPQVEVSTLPNGITVASLDLKIPAAAIAVVSDSGVIREEASTAGATLFVERNVFKATDTHTTRESVQEMEELGGTVTSSTSRETLTITGDVLHQDIPRALNLFARGIFRSKLDPEEFEELRQQLIDENSEIYIDSMVPDMFYSVAYGDQPLARTVVPTTEDLMKLTPDHVRQFRRHCIRPSRTIVAITGVSHSEAISFVRESFGEFQDEEISEKSPLGETKYLGGNLFFKSNTEMEDPHSQDRPTSHVCLAFEGPPVDNPSKMFAASLLSVILGGGDAFSSGGPGKGMGSRIYQGVMTSMPGIEACHAFYSSHVKTGLFGIHARVEHDKDIVSGMIEVLSVLYLGAVKEITEAELSRAKNQLKSSIFMNLETRSILADDIARQVLYYRKRYDETEMAHLINDITCMDVQKVAHEMLQTNPTLVVVGKDLPPSKRYDRYGQLLKNHPIMSEFSKKL
eukprot:TRINITY_DN21626_c0_g1_i1.p1 TRINITY_DN21626_c0_g1~~TRINITY_DN21626_c0_g1_i1.p1  ORF type:complete len:507 (+),score=108.67 TRINITY_DN21626_c0_g1_i1:1423-2943(+)